LVILPSQTASIDLKHRWLICINSVVFGLNHYICLTFPCCCSGINP